MQKTIHSDEHVVLRNLLRATRKARGLTQVDLAKRLEETQSLISKIERGERMLDVIEFADYAAAMGMKPAAFFAVFWRALSKARNRRAN